MHLEIRPEPSDQERAAIAAALAQEAAESAPSAWSSSALPRHEELEEP
jgi:hypothetical protein